MSNALTLASFKVKLFFSPSYRGRFGPLPLIVLMLLFVPSGLGMGFAFGAFMDTLDSIQLFATLAAGLSAMMAFGFVFSLGAGITAQPCELDFLMTSPIKPREYLVADMLFQLTSVMLAGGVALVGAVIGLLGGLGEPLVRAIPLMLVVALYGLLIFFIIQSLTIARIRHPKAKVKDLTLVLLVLSLMAMLPVAGGLFEDVAGYLLFTPQGAFAVLAENAIFGPSAEPLLDMVAMLSAVGWFVAISAIWLRLSGKYFFHGVKPTLSGGFGQVDMGVKMAQQRRMIGAFGGLTDKIALKTTVGSDLSLMTRLNLVRVWRDGSIVFVVLLIGLFLGSGLLGSADPGDASAFQINTIQGATWPIAILALNWCYYERANLWIPVVGGRSLVTYFRGLMTSFIIIGLGMAAVMMAILAVAGRELDMASIAFTILAPFGDSIVAALLLTRVQVKPGAFSPGLLAVLFFTFLGGAAIAFAGSIGVGLIGDGSSLLVAIQAVAVALLAVVIYYLGLKAVSGLSRSFRFQ